VRARALTTLILLGLVCAGCGQAGAGQGTSSQSTAPSLKAHPQSIDPVGGGSQPPAPGASSGPGAVSVGPSSGGALPQPVSDAQIRAELQASGLSANAQQAALTPSGLAVAPIGAPLVVQQVIDAGNQIAHLPYRFGGGHGAFEDNAYDCSGSISYVFAAAGLLNATVTSGELMSWGDPGRGKWITVFANAGHTFMYIAGLRFDTVALAQTGSRWSNRSATERDGFVVRHPPGL
jgi:hypothetical protein